VYIRIKACNRFIAWSGFKYTTTYRISIGNTNLEEMVMQWRLMSHYLLQSERMGIRSGFLVFMSVELRISELFMLRIEQQKH
jgi:hypothetical protein